MAKFTRPSGITVSVTGPAELAPGLPSPKRGIKPSIKRRDGVLDDDSLIIEALLKQDFELVDSVPLQIPPAARPKKRGGAAPSSAVTLDVPLGPKERAVILLEDEGEYRWVVDGKALPSSAPKRGRGKLAKRQLRFSIELKAAPSPPAITIKRGDAKRNWLADKLTGKVIAYVFRFAVKLVGKKVGEFLERKVEQGLVTITTSDPQQWKRLSDTAALPSTLPVDRPARLLLLLHGTFSSTVGSFGALGIVPEGRDFLCRAIATYDAVLGFDHPTLSVDPLKNATDLVARLRRVNWPQPPEIELIAYSRGGLVARSLIEQLLPVSDWGATIGRVVFVGCTNGGTQLAEPDNWHRFADYYTNLALGATRALSFFPGAQGIATISGQVVRGVGVLVKALASGVITDNLLPGLAAMKPDGAFVTTINKEQPGQPVAANTRYYVVTSDFEPDKALNAGSTPELPPKLLMRLADWGADKLFGEANDLVVHVRSMNEIDPMLGDYVKGKLDYGTNNMVYHTNYFTRDTTATQLIEWFGIPKAASAMVKRGSRKIAPAAHRRRITTFRKKMAKELKELEWSSLNTPSSTPFFRGACTACCMIIPQSPKHRANKSSTSTVRNVGKVLKKPAPIRPKPASKSAQIKKGKQRGLRKLTLRGRRDFPSSARVERSPSPKRSAKESATIKRKADRPSKKDDTRLERAPAANSQVDYKQKVECHFRAEMDSKVMVNKTVSVDVTIARHALQVMARRAGVVAAAGVDEEKKLTVQITERHNFRIDGERRVEIDVPKPGTEANVSFDVTGLVAGEEGELWVQVRQGPVPLVTLKLKPHIIALASASPVERMPVEHELLAMPPPEPPLDQLLIEESFVGNDVKYHYFLDLPSLRIRKHFESPVITGRDSYITKIMNRIGDAWAGSGRDQLEAFETDLKAIGAMMFTELMPREMQELLWDKRGSITSVQVFSMEPYIPWELVYLKDPRKRVIDETSKFLGELGLVRWLYDGYPPAQLFLGDGRARYIIPTYKDDNVLPDAAGEEQMMKKLFKATAVKARVLDVQKLLRRPGGFDLLHFGGHAEAAGEQQADARLILDQLEDGNTENALLATTVSQIAQLESDGHRPIVVLNACESARMSRGFASMGGFASAFVGRGAGLFIGTHWSVGDSPARTFIEEFYKSFTGHKHGAKPLQLREAVMKARQAARDAGDATWLAYVVYGHPRAVVRASG